MLSDIYTNATATQDLSSGRNSLPASPTRPTYNSPEGRTGSRSILSRLISLFLVSACLILTQAPSTAALTARSELYSSQDTPRIINHIQSPTYGRKVIKIGDCDYVACRRLMEAERVQGVERPQTTKNGIILSEHLIAKRIMQGIKRSETETHFPTASAIDSAASTSSGFAPQAFPTAALKAEQGASSTLANFSDDSVSSTSSGKFPIVGPPTASSSVSTESSSSTLSQPSIVNRDYTPIAISTTKRSTRRPSPTGNIEKSPDDLSDDLLSHFDLEADDGNMQVSWN